MLTWEDAYYANNEPGDCSDQMGTNDGAFDYLCDGRYAQDPLGLDVAKMSYLVYSLGEGIIGQVAITGKHQWIYADKHTTRCLPSSEYCNGWQTQFSAGIKTIAVVPIVPHGVVQLGSLHSVVEDMKLLTHIKDVFYSLQNSDSTSISYPIQYLTHSNSCLSEASLKSSGSEVFNDFPRSSDIIAVSHRNIDQSCSFLLSGTTIEVPQDIFALSIARLKKAVEVVNDHVVVESTVTMDHQSPDVIPKSATLTSEQETCVPMESNYKDMGEEAKSCWRKMSVHIGHSNASVLHSYSSETPKFDEILPLDGFLGCSFPSSRVPDLHVVDAFNIDRVTHLQNEKPLLPKPVEFQTTESAISCTDTVNSALRFSAGCELYEALGAVFKNQNDSSSCRESKRTKYEIIEPVERTAGSLFTMEDGADYLLGAVVTNSFTLSGTIKDDHLSCRSEESFLTTGKAPQTPHHVKPTVFASGSVTHSATCVEDAKNNPTLIWDSTKSCNLRPSKDLPSKSPSASSKHSEIHTESAKINRKRARPGESCRPRPRDRQLIQDRVKELRELVPNGSKCSIDSLLERTIKHMFFLQHVTNHADKLRKGAESKFGDNKMSLLDNCHEHGSSWALDVGGPTEVCPLVVENRNVDGQMLVEMLCEECNRFLEIAEAIKNLGLTILKGTTEARGENVWACFLVERQNNRSTHRMDVLWSLMQLLQPKTAM